MSGSQAISSVAGRGPVKIVTVLLMAIQATTVWYLVGTLVFPLTVTLATAWVVFTEFRMELPNSTRLRLCIVMSVVFVIKSRVAPIPVRVTAVTTMTQFAHVCGQFLMLLQLLLLATGRNRRILPQVIPWLGAAVMICAGDIYVTDEQRSVFQLFVITFITFAAVFSALNREMFARDRATLRTPALGLLLIAVGALSWWSASLLHNHSRDIETLISNLVDPSRMPQESGFTTQGRLRSIVRFQDTNAESVAMRIYSDTEPGYLRGFVFGQYSPNSREWLPNKTVDAAVQQSILGDVLRDDDENVFYLPHAREVLLKDSMQFWPVNELDGAIFLPPNAACAVAAVDALAITGEGNLSAPNLPVGYPYTIHTAEPPPVVSLAEADIEKYRYADLSPVPQVARDLADRLVKGDRTFDERTNAVADYFRQNFEYSTNFEIPPGNDPIAWFLQNGKEGHCEYFATAAAMILRAGGIPTRYVTGFSAAERNDYGDFWVVRNRFAHAWVEAWDKDRSRWVIVEATPPAGIPTASKAGQLAQLWASVTNRYHVFRVRLYQRGGLWAIQSLLSSWWFRAVLGVALIWLLVRLRVWNRRSSATQRTRSDPHARAFQQLLARVDSRLKRRHGLERLVHETLHQFAARVVETVPDADTISTWYRAYAQARYSPISDRAITELRTAARKL